MILWLLHSSNQPKNLINEEIPSSTAKSSSPPPFYVLDPNDYQHYFPDTASFEAAKQHAPFLDLPSSLNYNDSLVAYYYRLRSYRKHIRKTDDDRYWVVTEFLPNVPWAGTANTISAAAGHHIVEGMWFWDAPTFVEDYIRFWYLGGGGKNQKQAPQRHIARYTNWIYHATWQYAQLWGFDEPRRSLLRDTLPHAANVFRTTYVDKYLTNSTRNEGQWNTSGRVCWTQDDGYDAMEVSVSGGGCRPTIAAALWGEATALVRVAKLLMMKDNLQQPDIIQEFSAWALFSKQVITQQHWNPAIESFAVIPPPKRQEEEYFQPGLAPANCDIHKERPPNKLVQVRELLAFMPWFYSSLLDHKNDDNITAFARQFQWLLESTTDNGFTAPWGLRTVQRNTPCYNYSWDHGDCWNGPTWPYETSRVLTAVANLLADYNNTAVVDASGMTHKIWEQLFLQYARQHTQTTAVNDTARPLPSSGHIFENLHPDLGYWNNRARMYWRNDTHKDMGDDYNHSTFLDLVFRCWLGIRLSTTGVTQPWLVLNPLIQAPHFAADRIPYRGRVLSIVYDPTGDHYPRVFPQKENLGLVVLLEGRLVAHRPDLGPVVIQEEPPQAHPQSFLEIE
ncbi:Inherit from bactNOG: domain protein [Seminavis robusta]|uniref:Inherit from bactNOG: domain protein n=1 Tax=Seminavis robusta TaxID=568900 RepID=A0A9N8HXQ5_9STRA|nr:Inherit from bactNOG: domain protein [Seminavis robusta]|eukprot:Sro3264_g346000.1 Inherit from bactNOG: domain protein (619) ;mRNA; r:3204-5278